MEGEKMVCNYSVEILIFIIFSAGIFLAFSGDFRFNIRNRAEKIANKTKGFLWDFRNTEYWKAKRREQIDIEIYESLSFIRNISALGKGRNIGSDFLITQLAERDCILKAAYMKMLSLLRMNKRREAAEAFAEETGTVMGREFAGLLLQWDELDPVALSEILLSHQKTIKEARMTARKKRDEAISDIIYLPIVANVMMICINCIYTTYYLQQQEMFEMFF